MEYTSLSFFPPKHQGKCLSAAVYINSLRDHQVRCGRVRREEKDSNKTHIPHQPSDHLNHSSVMGIGVASVECAKLCHLGRQGN